MQLFNLLDISIGVFGQTFDIELGWIGQFIKILVEGVGSVGLGVILFSIILKLIVMPFDVIQRISMKKQNEKMKQNKDKMERLQKQYANNKDLYNQKVAEMYKKEGMSMFSSCLPMILSLIIFIVAINNFNAYSQYATVQNYNDMVNAYNTEISQYCVDIDTLEDTDITVGESVVTVKDADTAGKYIYFTVPKTDDNSVAAIKATSILDRSYYVDTTKAYTDLKTQIDAYLTDPATATEEQKAQACKDFFVSEAQNAVVEKYENTVQDRMSFLWIKNIWATDASFKHPVLEYSDFQTSIAERGGCGSCGTVSTNLENKDTNAYREETYKVVTGKLGEYKNQANGYYILIALSIGTILLQQWVSMRSQKEQNQYSSVDGQGAMSQKTMMIMMTVMFAFFSFMYSAAFAIYLIVGNVITLASTLIINKIVDVNERKKTEREMQAKYDQRFPGRKRNNSKK